jgi:hypothetical protein
VRPFVLGRCLHIGRIRATICNVRLPLARTAVCARTQLRKREAHCIRRYSLETETEVIAQEHGDHGSSAASRNGNALNLDIDPVG